ncbi:cell division cycle-associated protein 2 [Porphyrio hochstetteri]
MARRAEGSRAPLSEWGGGGGRGAAPARGRPGDSGGARPRGKENAGGASLARERARGRDPGRGSRRCGAGAATSPRAERARGAAASALSSRESREAAAGGRRSMPGEERAEEGAGRGVWEELRGKPVDFATVTIAEFGITRESFAKPFAGKSPTLLKFRRRSAIGARGSPENNTLIQYLAQQRSNKWKEAFAQVSPLQHGNVRLLKDKINAFQTSCEALQEAEGESGFSKLPQVEDASQDAGCYCSSDHIAGGVTSNAASGLSRSKEEHKSGYSLRSLLKARPVKQLTDGMKEYSNDAVDEGGEALQTVEKTGTRRSEKPKKRVTFGKVLSPEIFDEALPANTPLCKGATPVCHPASQSHSAFARSALIGEPLSQPNFDECVEPLQGLVESSIAAEDLLPFENAEAQTDKSDLVRTHSTKRKRSTGSEWADFSILRATSAEKDEKTKNPRKNKCQRQKKMTACPSKRK